MTLSRKAIRPFQTACLLRHNVLPVSIDYRLCPEINLIDGPITDVRDAYGWLQTGLQAVVRSRGILVDEKRIVVIGWSTGGHLAMTTAWKSKEAGLRPPVAILSFYGPTDFESGGKLIDLHVLSLFCFALSNDAFLPPPSPSLQQSVTPLTPSFRPPQISMSGGPKCTRSGGCQWTTSSPLCLRNQ